MTKRLQVRTRQTLRKGRRQTPFGDAGAKLAAIRRAAQDSFPTADIGQMTAEIERGYSRKGRR